MLSENVILKKSNGEICCFKNPSIRFRRSNEINQIYGEGIAYSLPPLPLASEDW